jgi:hypothetical protein
MHQETCSIRDQLNLTIVNIFLFETHTIYLYLTKWWILLCPATVCLLFYAN